MYFGNSQHQICLLRLQIFLRALEFRSLELWALELWALKLWALEHWVLKLWALEHWALTLVLTHVLEHQKSGTSRARIPAFPFSFLVRANVCEFEAGMAC